MDIVKSFHGRQPGRRGKGGGIRPSNSEAISVIVIIIIVDFLGGRAEFSTCNLARSGDQPGLELTEVFLHVPPECWD